MSESFGKWRYRLWPVHANEYFKVMPLLLMKLLVALNYTLLYNTKETLMIAASKGGAEVIPILKGWVVIPAAFLFMAIYAKMSNHLSRQNLFYATICPFIVFFILFTFVLYPYRESLYPNKSAAWLQEILGPQRFHWVAIYKHWMNAAFYVFAELWGVVVINLLFWTFANQICTVSEAKRFYTLFSAAGDLGAVVSAPLMWHSKLLSAGSFDIRVSYVLTYTIMIGLAVVALYAWTNRYITITPQGATTVASEKPKTKLSLWSSFKMIIRSSYLLHLCMIVIGYSLALNLIEVFWKANLTLAFPDENDYLSFMSSFSTYTGLVSTIATFLAAGFIIRRFGWHFSAQITPFLVCSSGLIFFAFYYKQEALAPLFAKLDMSPVLFLAYFGAAQSILSRTCKYAFLDPTKEMAYIPLDEESKIKGKAAVDVVASRLGKSGSSWIQAGLIELAGSGSVLSIAGFIAPIILATGALWSHAVYALNKLFQKRSHQQPSPN